MGISNGPSSPREGEVSSTNRLNVTGSYRRAANDEVFALLGDRVNGLPEGIRFIGNSIQAGALSAIKGRDELVSGVIKGGTTQTLVDETIAQTRIAFYAESTELKAA